MSVEASSTQSFTHAGTLKNVFGLAVKNALLSIVTLTLYRFWARTSIRRRVWSRAWVMGDSFEYTGNGWDLFRGFLISLPCFFLPAVFVFYIAPFVMDPNVAAWLVPLFYVIAVPVIAAARYWMRRYQLSRTRWRGIRLGLAGSAWGFAAASWGWTMLQTLTLGWYTPVARMNRAKLMWENTRFGDQPFEFSGDPEGLAKGLWWPFALGWFGPLLAFIGSYILTVFIVVSVGLSAGFENFATPQGGEPSPQIVAAMIVIGVSWVVLGFTLWLLFWAPYRAAAMNRIASLVSLDGARFKLSAGTWSLFGVTLAGWAITIFSLGLLAPLAGLMQVRYVLNRLELIGTPRFAEIGQSVMNEERAGESFADAFDLDLGVGLI